LETASKVDPERGSLEDIVASSKRAAELTNQLLAYAGKGRFVVTRFDLSELIKEIPHLIQASIPKMVRLELALAPGLPWLEADATQIRQIVMNLVINAAEAIGSEEGTVRISTGMPGLSGWTKANPSNTFTWKSAIQAAAWTRNAGKNLRSVFHHQDYRAGPRSGGGFRDRPQP